MSDLRPRSYSSKKPGTLARHGQLRSHGPVKTLAKFIAAALAVVLVSGASVAAVAVWDVVGNVKPGVTLGAQDEHAPPLVGPIKGAVNVAIIGSDSREGQGYGFGDPEEETAVLNDVTMLLHVSADHKSATVVSFPRDMFVEIPSCPDPDDPDNPFYAMGSQKLNTTLGYGGMNCTVLTLEALTGLEIDYAATVQFLGVVEMSNAVGGVPVCISTRLEDPRTDLVLAPGIHNLKGMDALQFLRTRHGVGDGSDLSRISNQQNFLSSLVRTVKSKDTLTNPMKLYGLARAAVDNMEMSESLTSLDTIVSIAQVLKGIDLDKVVFVQYPVGDVDGGVAPRWDIADEMFLALGNDQPITLSGEFGRGAVAKSTAGNESPAPTASDDGDNATETDASDNASETDPTEASQAPTPPGQLPKSVTGQTAEDVTCATGRTLDDQ